MERLARIVTRVTAVLLVASVALIVPSLAGVGASLPSVIALLGLGLLLEAGRRRPDLAVRVRSGPLRDGLRAVPIGVVLAALVGLGSLGATAGELQALGGLCGLLGMLNYFLRPVYGLVAGAIRYLDRTVSGTG